MRTTDVAAMCESSRCEYNAGFIVVKPNDMTKQLYQTVKSVTGESAETDDQVALNNAIKALQNQQTGLTVTALNKRRFLSGREYFEKPGRWFPLNSDGKCIEKNYSNCAVVVHNNWIVGKAAKVYRFREHLMWLFDGDDQYYTSSTRLYLTYTNKAHEERELINKRRAIRVESEISALKTAMTIGYLLNRTVILHKFRVGHKAIQYPLNSFIHIKTFDTEFSGSTVKAASYATQKFLTRSHMNCNNKQW